MNISKPSKEAHCGTGFGCLLSTSPGYLFAWVWWDVFGKHGGRQTFHPVKIWCKTYSH